MINDILKYFALAVILILIQILLLNRVYLFGFINPYLYFGFILLLPFNLPKALVLLIAFFLGLIIDIFSDTPGMHTFASVFGTYFRPYVVNLIAPKDEYEPLKPFASSMGYPKYFTYSYMLIFLHHFSLFYIEVFRLSDFFYTFIRVILSSIATLFLFFLLQAFLDKRSIR